MRIAFPWTKKYLLGCNKRQLPSQEATAGRK
jgi:hypothetical protein